MLEFPDYIRSGASEQCAKGMSGIEKFHAHCTKVHAQNPAAIDPRALQTLPPDECAHAYLQFIFAIYSAKFIELTASLIQSTIDGRFLIFGFCGRGLIETTATLRYYNQKLTTIIKRASDRDALLPEEYAQIIRLLDDHARAGRFDWSFLWSEGRSAMTKRILAERPGSKKSDGKKQSNPVQINATTMVDAWSKDEPGVALIYHYFCDLVHPNMGSNLLMMGEDKRGLIVAADVTKTVGTVLVIEGIEYVSGLFESLANL